MRLVLDKGLAAQIAAFHEVVMSDFNLALEVALVVADIAQHHGTSASRGLGDGGRRRDKGWHELIDV